MAIINSMASSMIIMDNIMVAHILIASHFARFQSYVAALHDLVGPS